MIYWDSEVQPAFQEKPKRKYEPSVVAWINTDFDAQETKVNWFPNFGEWVAEATIAEVLIGFNTKGFDIPNFENSPDPPEFAQEKSFDFLWYLQEKITGDAVQQVKGLSLDVLAELTLDRRKIKLDASAADLYRTGNFPLLEAYVSNDAELLYALVSFALAYGYVLYKRKTTDREGVSEMIDCNDLQDRIDQVASKGVVGW